MATQQTRMLGKIAVAPSVIVLFMWMIVPLVMTIYFSFLRYNLIQPNAACSLMTPGVMFDEASRCIAGFGNYKFFLTDPEFFKAALNSLAIVGSVLLISIVGGTLLALLLDQAIYGQGIVRILIIAPFFVMPTVSALVWKNMFMNPVSGLLAWVQKSLGFAPLDWFAHAPLTAVIIIVAWQWLPFATLIILTSLQSLDEEQKEASQMDGATPWAYFAYIIVPHLLRPVTVVVLIETIFLLNVFAEIYVTGTGGPAGNMPFLVYQYGMIKSNIGGASAGAIIAVILANIVAFFLMRMIGKNLEN